MNNSVVSEMWKLSMTLGYTCERCCVDQGVRLQLINGSAQGFYLEPIHMEGEGEKQENEVEDERDGEKCGVEEYQDNDNTMQMTHAMTCAQHLGLEPMSMCDIKRVL